MDLQQLSISRAKETQFNTKKIYSAEDLAKYFPRKYYDFRTLTTIKDAAEGEVCAVRGVVIKRSVGRKCYSVKIRDESNAILLITWFGSDYYFNQIIEEVEYTFCGRITRIEDGPKVMNSPYFFDMTHRNVAKIIPVYSKIPGMSNEYLTKSIRGAITMLSLEDHGPEEVYAKEHGMATWIEAYTHMHNPADEESYKKARKRVVYDELFNFYKTIGSQSSVTTESLFTLSATPKSDSYLDSLPFSLTNSQQKAIDSLREVFKGKKQTDTLIFGDVGAGKTLVAFWAMLAAGEAGKQAALMCPTQVLAEQHYNELAKVAKNFDFKAAYLVAGLRKKEKEEILKGLRDGSIDFVVGTHSIISDGIEMKALALAIVDEEHKFGVEQKEKIRSKAKEGVHYIAMSATPIPRSLALSIYNRNTKVLLIDEMPKDRKPIVTKVTSKEGAVYDFLLKHIKKGRQAYVICPLIEDSETGTFEDVQSVHESYKILQSYFATEPDVKISFITGNMTKAKISEEVEKFKKNETNILISTTIVEVGVNNQNANMIIIKSAERYGLAQLHQLRGRVGRGDIQSYCVLLTSSPAEKLDIMCRTANGFEVAEEDMKIRGAGSLSGVQQTGYSKEVELLIKHPSIAKQARVDAEQYLKGSK